MRNVLSSCSVATGLISVRRFTNRPITRGALRKPRILYRGTRPCQCSVGAQLVVNKSIPGRISSTCPGERQRSLHYAGHSLRTALLRPRNLCCTYEKKKPWYSSTFVHKELRRWNTVHVGASCHERHPRSNDKMLPCLRVPSVVLWWFVDSNQRPSDHGAACLLDHRPYHIFTSRDL